MAHVGVRSNEGEPLARNSNRSVAILGTRGYPSYYGGFETAVRRIAPYLADRGWDVTVYARPDGVVMDDPLRDPRVRTILTRGLESRSLSTLTYGFTSALSTARRRPDVALVMNVANGFWLPLLRTMRIPSVVNVDGIEWERDKWSPLGRRVFRMGASMTATHASRLVFDAEAIAAHWRDNFGADGDFIPYGGDEREELPIEPGLQHREYALMVARFVPENTVAEFLEAAVTLSENHDVVIVGSSGYGGEFDDKAAAIARDHDRIHWLGHLRDDDRLHSLWQHAGAYFHGHSVGGTNPALVQAMALGAPIVARETVYNSEVLGTDGGVLVHPTPHEIVRGVEKVITSPAIQEELSIAAKTRFKTHYTWDGVCAAYEDSLTAAIDATRPKQR